MCPLVALRELAMHASAALAFIDLVSQCATDWNLEGDTILLAANNDHIAP